MLLDIGRGFSVHESKDLQFMQKTRQSILIDDQSTHDLLKTGKVAIGCHFSEGFCRFAASQTIKTSKKTLKRAKAVGKQVGTVSA
jgi:hypothetical protein